MRAVRRVVVDGKVVASPADVAVMLDNALGMQLFVQGEQSCRDILSEPWVPTKPVLTSLLLEAFANEQTRTLRAACSRRCGG